MKNDMNKLILKLIAIILILLSSLFSLSGCWSRRELNDLGIVMGFAIDKGEKEELDVTVQLIKPGSISTISAGGSGGGTGASGQSNAYWNAKVSGSNLFYMLREITHMVDRKLYTAHAEAIVIGKDLAEEGIKNHLDFFMRDQEVRLSVMLLIADGKASDVFDTNPGLEQIPANNLAKLLQIQHVTSETPEMRIKDYIDCLESGSSSCALPFVKIRKQGEDNNLAIEGSAVLKKDKMVGELDNKETRGLLWTLGKVESGIIDVQAPIDGIAEIEIIEAKSKSTPAIQADGTIAINVEVKVTGFLGTQSSTADLTKKENTEALKTAAGEAIKDEIKRALKKARDLDADVFQFGELIKKKYPKKWKGMSDQWDEEFKKLKVNMNVEVKITQSGRITKPAVH
ncbi:MAG: Ger(x)C family spore germination protein [Candidatus Pacebacteria bacterium]|nr:Ger(x)C family spore germination protein [Candidatus Paceibacterota bacterium]